MKAKLKHGSIVKGKIAKIFIKKGIAVPLDEFKPKTANQVADLIQKSNTIEELEQFKDDKRQVAKMAYGKKKKALEKE